MGFAVLQCNSKSYFQAILTNKNNIPLPINPFLPTGQFMAPKVIILTKCLIDVLFFSVVLMFLYVEQDVNLA